MRREFALVLETYNNNLSKLSLKLSNAIGKTFQSTLDYLFGKLEGMMNG